MKAAALGKCGLCEREGCELTEHHLTPKELGGTFLPTAMLCKPCHKQIHSLYTNEDLVTLALTTIPALQHDETIASFLRYIRKQPPGVIPKVKKSARVRQR